MDNLFTSIQSYTKDLQINELKNTVKELKKELKKMEALKTLCADQQKVLQCQSKTLRKYQQLLKNIL